ncbi:MAG TPA: hypothetical protein PKB02_13700 [Anaerohalosphaeraceae bacterium]|nr:hypothetical protein [Anaerohalosphaeraceae bacterium]
MTEKVKLKSPIKKLLKKAFSLCKDNKYEEAVGLLKQIIKQAPEVPFSYGHLAAIAWRQGKLKEANRYFRKTTTLIPESSLASLGVFHTYWKMEQYKKALNEIKRHKKAGGKCKDYDAILAGLKKKKIIDDKMNLLC